MQKNKNQRARDLAHKHAVLTASWIEEILYFIYSHILDDYGASHNKQPNQVIIRESVTTKTNIEAVALFVNAQKGKYIMDCLTETSRLNATLARDLYTNTEYMWSGSVKSQDFYEISKLLDNTQGGSDIPQMDFFVIIVPIENNIERNGIIREDSSNRVSFFMNICQNNCDVKLSQILNHNLLPTNILYAK